MQTSYDIIIVGGGIVGATLACALAQQTSLSIAVLDSHLSNFTGEKNSYHHRVSAISLSSQRIFKALHVWDEIVQNRVSPFTKIDVWEDKNPAGICFSAVEIAEPILGFIIENRVIQTALIQKLQQYPHVEFIAPIKLKNIHVTENTVELVTEDQHILQSRLVVAADGANSWVRNQMDIEISKEDYAQMAIVAQVQTQLPHEKIARQVFKSSGPLAFLPLHDAHTSSIVWSVPQAEGERLLALDNDLFKQELATAFTGRLGNIIAVEPRHSFELSKQQAKQYVQSRVALVGDAAHVVHPLAGQGVNMGLLDAASLSEIIMTTDKKRRDFSSMSTLRQYERWRRADNFPMAAGIHLLKHIFSNETKLVRTLRSCGISLTNNSHWIKKIFIQQAVGNRSGLPQLSRTNSSQRY